MLFNILNSSIWKIKTEEWNIFSKSKKKKVKKNISSMKRETIRDLMMESQNILNPEFNKNILNKINENNESINFSSENTELSSQDEKKMSDFSEEISNFKIQ